MNGWTHERRAKQSAMIQQWRPWEHSTGARTPEGKALSSRNACKGVTRAKRLKEMNGLLREHKQLMRELNDLIER